MATYRVHRKAIEALPPETDAELSLIQVTSNESGVVLTRTKYSDLPIHHLESTNQPVRYGMVITHMELDPEDDNYIFCTTRDVALLLEQPDS